MNGESGIRRAIGGVLYGNWLTTAVRLPLGGLMLYSGAVKMADPSLFAAAVVQYDILPALLAPYAALVIPAIECIIGLSLLAGFRVRASSAIAVLLMAVFMIAVSVNLARGRLIDCGCFQPALTGLGSAGTLGPWLLVRNAALLAGFALLFRADRHLLSLEHSIEKSKLKNLEKSKYE